MGGERTTTSTQTGTTYQPTGMERKLNKAQYEDYMAARPQMKETTANMSNMINALLTGQSPLAGFYGKLGEGISPDVVNSLTQRALTDVNAQLALSGAGTFLESGPAQAIGARTAGDIRNQAEQFNIGNKVNLLGMGLGYGQGGQQVGLMQSGQLGGRLAGLRGINQTGTQSTIGMNPFVKSFETSLGQTLGTPRFGMGPSYSGGFGFNQSPWR